MTTWKYHEDENGLHFEAPDEQFLMKQMELAEAQREAITQALRGVRFLEEEEDES